MTSGCKYGGKIEEKNVVIPEITLPFCHAGGNRAFFGIGLYFMLVIHSGSLSLGVSVLLLASLSSFVAHLTGLRVPAFPSNYPSNHFGRGKLRSKLISELPKDCRQQDGVVSFRNESTLEV